MIDKALKYDDDMLARLILAISGKVKRDYLESTTLSENTSITFDNDKKFIKCSCEIKGFYSAGFEEVKAEISYDTFVESIICVKKHLKAEKIIFQNDSFNKEFENKVNKSQTR